MIIKAVFMGENGSLDYQKGRMYTLYVKDFDTHLSIGVVSAENPDNYCAYADIKEFFKNWRVV